MMMQAQLTRQKLYRCIRRYFEAQSVHEVETPIMDIAGNTDPAIDSFQTTAANSDPRWLRTSPEFFHKRLLAEGSGSIFEIAKVFRRGEISARHHPEFTMLEYYRVGFDEFDLMACLANLMAQIRADFFLPTWPVRRLSYRNWFCETLGFDPITAALSDLQARVSALGVVGEFQRDDCLDLIRTHQLEALLPAEQLSFVYDFPASQAALAKLNADGETARRFELFAGGMELANGYFELTDASEQRRRFLADLARRESMALPCVRIDDALLHALGQGMPCCAGVAVGLDRLLMILTGHTRIDSVL